MKMLASPLVYVGPTLSRDEVIAALPGSVVRPPIARGDLYRDRLLRGAVFVILDGVFLQQQAVSPREILDVIADGGLVIGAASMGALRAAECWPAGMLGVGSIYRLFRAGRLESDDEVALTFDPDDPQRSASVALVNVRYAVFRALKERRLDRDLAIRIVASARTLFYADRRWPTILRRAGVETPDATLLAALASYDLKRLDALRALCRVARLRARDPELHCRPRRSHSAFTLSESTRERSYEASHEGSNAANSTDFSRWLVASGRYARYARGLEGCVENPELFAERLRARVARRRELDAELFRFQAVKRLAAQAKAIDVVPTERDRHEAEQRIALEHGVESWAELGRALPALSELCGAYREILAAASAMRRRSFSGP